MRISEMLPTTAATQMRRSELGFEATK